MKILKRDNYVIALRDNGDTQHFLGVKFSKNYSSQVLFDRYFPESRGTEENINQGLLLQAVVKGGSTLKELNEIDPKQLIDRIKYVPSDVPNYEVFEVMAQEIFQHAYQCSLIAHGKSH